ncbi:MAG: zinc ribbon domain-containing protein [Lachnospiraceae bacterium]|nr:zinc ribbon domain-containing protein [Lachnospiraceae bacterium]
MKCSVCGSEVADGLKFCPQCGAPLAAASAETPAAPAQPYTPVYQGGGAPAPAPVYAPVYGAPPTQPVYQPSYMGDENVTQKMKARQGEKAADAGVVSTGAFFWLTVLYAIPVIGFIAVLVMSFSGRNKSLKNFAKSRLIMLLIGLAVVIIGGILMWIFKDQIIAAMGLTWEDIAAAFGTT